MKRRGFILSTLAAIPGSLLALPSTFTLYQDKKGFKVNSGEARNGKHFTMKGVAKNSLDVKISSNDTDGGIAVFEQTGHMPKGGPPLHIHKFQDEWFYILEGEYIFQLGAERLSMKTGDTIFLPRAVPHGFIQMSDKARVMVSFFPAGKIEDFFRTTAAMTGEPTLEEIKKVFEDHDMLYAGPPLKP